LFDQVRILLDRVPDAGENHSLSLQVLLEAVVYLLAFIDRPYACEELSLRLGDAELLESVPDLTGNVLPLLRGLLRRVGVVVEVLEMDWREVDAPGRHRSVHEVLQCPHPEILHPTRL